MKHLLLAISFVLSFTICRAQLNDFNYLNQLPPADTPKVFLSGITERIAISNDNTEIYFNDSAGISYCKYSNGVWSKPVVLIQGYMCPSLSSNNKTMYVQDAKIDVWYLFRTDSGWSIPRKFWGNLKTKHYLQSTSKSNYYLSYNLQGPVHGAISRLIIQNSDTTAQSLGAPINSDDNGVDFYISRDESYIIFVRHPENEGGNLYISFQRTDGSWTNPIKFNALINSICWEWGPFVTFDNKYLFFTRSGGCSHKQHSVYWVRIDKTIEALRVQALSQK